MIEAVIEFGTKMTRLYAREVPRDNEELTLAIRYVLDPEMAFYRQYGTITIPAGTIV